MLAIIIPTLNEEKNIIGLINIFRKYFPAATFFIADSSTDKTPQIIERAFKNDENINLLLCGRKGRGAAIVEAYKDIKANCCADFIVVADADFSHDPKDLPILINKLNHNDVVIGSRYLPESKIIGWPINRYIFSLFSNLLARNVLKLGVKDYTNGYRAFTLNALKSLNLNLLNADGYIMLSQELVQWHNAGMRIAEVPTRFVNRQRGKSNLKLKLIAESLLVIFKLAKTVERK